MVGIYTGSAVKGPIEPIDDFCQIDLTMAQTTTKTAILSIGGLKSENLPVLRAAFNAVPGVVKIDFSLERSVAVLDFDPSQSHIDDFLRAVLKAGFQVL
ncbi:MAG: Heavy-metal-associated protein [Deltaproteobacteria bacterium]|nr:Heavy-metal-associated protein [Deltaproteobacteria bacterium]